MGSRIVHVLLPRPWRLYSDRLEFTLVAILWICWTCKSLSPGYAASLSTFQANKVVGRGDNDGDGDVLIMWELAVNSPPSSPRLAPLVVGSSGYGAIDTVASSPVSTHGDTPIHRKDRFAEGRVISYVLLLLVSISVVISAGILMAMGESGESFTTSLS
jgi:hypothetical protein